MPKWISIRLVSQYYATRNDCWLCQNVQCCHQKPTKQYCPGRGTNHVSDCEQSGILDHRAYTSHFPSPHSWDRHESVHCLLLTNSLHLHPAGYGWWHYPHSNPFVAQNPNRWHRSQLVKWTAPSQSRSIGCHSHLHITRTVHCCSKKWDPVGDEYSVRRYRFRDHIRTDHYQNWKRPCRP